MNALITFNFRNFMHPKTRESFQAACARWGCEYVEVTQRLRLPDGRSIHHWWQKTLVYDGIAAKFDRVAVLDADMLIRDDCPSLFDAVPPETFGAVSRIQPGMPKRKDPDIDLVFHARSQGCEVPKKELHLNGGLTVYSPTIHREPLQAWRDAGTKLKWQVNYATDQGALSVVLYRLKTPVTWLPYEFNSLQAAARPTRMATYVYHFTKFRPVHKGIEACEWRTEATAGSSASTRTCRSLGGE